MQCQPASALDLFTDSVRDSGDATMVSVLEFDRHIEAERLEAAAWCSIKAHPILSSRLVRGKGPAYWEYQELDASSSLVHLVDIGTDDYRPHVIKGMVPYNAPQVLFRILRSPERDVIVVSLAHAAADGSGIKELTNDLMRAYLEPHAIAPCKDILPVRDTLWTKDLAGSSCQEMDMQLADTMWPIDLKPSQAPSTYHRAVVDQEGIATLKIKAARHSGTINDLLMATYFLTLSEMTDITGPHGLSFPVNLRQHLRDGSRVMSNQAANVTFQLNHHRGEGMDGLLPKVIAETSAMKRRGIGIREQVAFDSSCDPEGRAIERMVEEMAKRQRQGLANIFISNPGPISLPLVPGLRDAYVAYPGGYMPTTCYIVSTFNGRMSITMGYQQDPASIDLTLQMMNGFLENLGIGNHGRLL